MQISQRGPRRVSIGIAWSVLVLLMLFGIWIMSFMGIGGLIGGLVFFGVLGTLAGIKAWGAFTGTQRVALTAK